MSCAQVTSAPRPAFSLVSFYDLELNGKDEQGRTREQILKWDDRKLEFCHDYIQTLFPLPETSMFSYNAPVIDTKTMEAFRSRADLRMSLSWSLERMLQFYGFTQKLPGNKTEEEEQLEKSEDGPSSAGAGQEAEQQVDTTAAQTYRPEIEYRIVRGSNFEAASKNWTVRMDHNHLRITRILRCLRILGLPHECEAFYEALKEVYEDPKIKIGERPMMFWTRAVRQPLHIAPDGKETKWLAEWAEENATQNQMSY